MFDFLGLTEGARCRKAQKKRNDLNAKNERELREYEEEERDLMEKVVVWQKLAEDLMKKHPGEYFTCKRIARELHATGLQYYYYTQNGYVNPYDYADARAQKKLHNKILFCNTGDRVHLPNGFDEVEVDLKTYYYWKK